jgi:hypothetical protein
MPAHLVPVIGQRLTMGCWAACFAMMDSWRSHATLPIQATLGKLGKDYVDAYAQNTGLLTPQVSSALATLQLVREPPSNPTVARWQQLSASGPLFVVVDEQPHPGRFSVHARVVFEIQNNPANTVSFNDPAGNRLAGSVRQQSLAQFVADYEQLAGTGWAGVQIIHY